MSQRGWIGVDLDGTLAHYEGWMGHEHIGEPVPTMVERVKQLLSIGHTVKVFTARVAGPDPSGDLGRIRDLIQDWTEKHIGVRLEVTNVKDFGMIMLYDDRCVQVEANTGRLIGGDA